MTNVIKIEWLQDYTDCETCGGSSAEGAIVTVSGVVLDFTPNASCCNSVSYSEGHVYNSILEHLGYVVESVNTYTGDEY